MNITEKIAIATLAVMGLLTGVYVWLTHKILKAQRESGAVQERALQAQIAANFIAEYFSPLMLSNMRELRRFKEEHGTNFASEFKTLREHNNKYEEIKEVDIARRQVKGYFFKLYFLLQTGVVSEDLIKKTIVPTSIDFLTKVVEPLEKEINVNYEKYDRARFDYFRKIYAAELQRSNEQSLSSNF